MPPPKSSFTRFYERLVAFNVESLFTRKRAPGPPRTVYVNQPLPAEFLDHKGRVKPEHVYTPNQVITSKYAIITFIPRNLLEQFRRVANMFFLALAIIQFFPTFTTITPGVAILPLLFIIAVTGLKDGYEDFKRHQSDKRVNYSTVRVLEGGGWNNPNAMQPKRKTFIRGLLPTGSSPQRGPDIEFDDVSDSDGIYGDKNMRPHWKKTLWEDVRVGDFVKLVEGESFPGDIMICATSEEEDVAFVETKNLDGETNLKSRHAVPTLIHLRTAADCADAKAFKINCDRPDNDMYRLNANVDYDGVKTPVDLSMTLLRGTLLKNTSWVIGIVMFTGLDTKIVMNSGNTPSKRSRVERQMNPQVFLNLGLMAVMAVVCAIVDSVLETRYYPLGAPWLYGDDRGGDNPRINGLITWAYAILTFQDIVPISLYISIEFVRTCQAIFIYLDPDIWYRKTDQPTIARSWNLSDDLGQIEYIFSDKTGTLTQVRGNLFYFHYNLMVFRQCSVGGKAYRGASSNEPVEDDPDFTPQVSRYPASTEKLDNSFSTAQWEAKAKPSGSSYQLSLTDGPSRPASDDDGDDVVHFHDSELQQDLELAVTVDETSEFASHARSLNGFFTVLSLCHTVLTGEDPETGNIIYKAQSPDEAALVQAAADVGFVFLGRDREILRLRTPFSPEIEQYELLNILEFTSARKRMSVILRKLGEDPRIFLLTKGADNVIFERLRAGGDDLKAITDRHLGEFANEGLRTLTLAYKVIRDEVYEAWNLRYRQANAELDDREEKVEAVCDEMERDFRLLGATAIEDRLQDGVPETIADLKRAGIKIWVATGDKLETAIAIGRSTNLITPDSNIVIIRGSNKRSAYEQMTIALQQYFSDFGGKESSGPEAQYRNNDPEIPLQRIMTGVSSIVGEGNGERDGGFVLVVDGAALLEAFATDENRDLLLRLGTKCDAVICCRVSPLQKALIVRLVKEGLKTMTLAIGDGANDVSMIQAADVGIGISGEEGLQAVNSSDYAIAQFRFLKRLLLVHGHWSYARNGTMILNFFYKNIMPVGVLWWFQIYSAWSGYYGFDYIYILFWNSLWTILPVIGIGLFDRILDDEILMQFPELYRYGRTGYWYNTKYFCIYMFDGIVQTVIIFFFIFYSYISPTSRPDGFQINMVELSSTMVFSAVLTADIFAGITSTAWTIPLVIAIAFGIIVIWCFTAIYSLVPPTYAPTNLWGLDEFIFRSAYFWLGLLLTFVLAISPRIIAKAWKISFFPDEIDIIRSKLKEDPHFDLSQLRLGLERFKRPPSRPFSRSSMRSPGPTQDVRMASRTDMATGLASVDRGFDFVTEEGGVAMRRMQSRLSEQKVPQRRSSPKKGKGTISHVFSLRRGLLRKSASILRKSE
ncbi:hypothetical protein AMATHDRAFT_141843 [Amanita thiersii Skay4041]|uniref:Phospholipid-transporting ATPase n=1 Tax=Amanita thiersii Skay4041 TaxID=703135 RepID=A0A2A9NV81_9AGAR|nr:hypothetical protein AMATHDRAFT_141843 [Amanita thiersii Skay4041]